MKAEWQPVRWEIHNLEQSLQSHPAPYRRAVIECDLGYKYRILGYRLRCYHGGKKVLDFRHEFLKDAMWDGQRFVETGEME